jgi:hypothetical protein
MGHIINCQFIQMRRLNMKKFIAAFVLFFISTNLSAEAWKGSILALVSEDFRNDPTFSFQLRVGSPDNREFYLLILPESVNTKRMLTETSVTVIGDEVAHDGVGPSQKTIMVKSVTYSPVPLPVPEEESGKKNILTLVIDFLNYSVSDTLSISQIDKILYTDTNSTRLNYKLNSFGKIKLIRDPTNSGKPEIYKISLNYNAMGCDTGKWTEDAIAMAVKQGVNLDLYTSKLFILPHGIQCNWLGQAYIGCRTAQCRAWIVANPYNADTKLTFAHELGHNFGFGHSSNDGNNDGISGDGIEDSCCFMGNGDGVNLKQVNAPHRDLLHWFDDFPNLIKNVTTSGKYALYPLERGKFAPGAIVLKLKRDVKSTYYLSVRKNLGPFGPGMLDFLDRLSIHYIVNGDLQTYLVKTIGIGESFVDTTNHVTVKLISTGVSALVDVSL